MDNKVIKNKKWFVIVLLNLFLMVGCGEEPKWKTMYNDCKDEVNNSLIEAKKDKNTQSIGEMAESMGMAACEMIKNTCEDNEEGFTCKALVDGKEKQ